MRVLALFIAFMILLSVPLIYAAATQPDNTQIADDLSDKDNETVNVIITFRDQPKTMIDHISSIMGVQHDTKAKAKAKVRDRIKDKGILKHEFSMIDSISATIPGSMLAELESDPDILSIEQDRKVHAFLSDSVPLIGADAAWSQQMNNTGLTGKGTTVCVIDTGIDYTHPDLGNCTLWNTSGNTEPYFNESLHPYENNITLEWIINRTGFTSIAVHFANISVEKCSDQPCDRVQVLDTDDNIIADYSGSYRDIWSPSVAGDTIKIRLIADPYVDDYGFYVDKILNGTAVHGWVSCPKVIGGWNMINGYWDPLDDDGHGTHVSGIIAGDGAIKGVAPDARLIAVKVLDKDGEGHDSDVLAGMDWCISNASVYNISVISMSLGSEEQYGSFCDSSFPIYSSYIDIAVSQNISVVIATGNDAKSTGVSSPACIRNATRVGATTKSDMIASYTNRGAAFADMLLAPGGNIYSTIPSDSYGSKSGTSMATPHISGAIALTVQASLDRYGTQLTPSYINDIFNLTGKPIYDSPTGLNFPRIDVLSAILHINTPPNITGKYNNMTEDSSTQITINDTDSVFFNISVSVPVNYSWYLNTTPVGADQNNWTFDTGYNDSGLWHLTVSASNENGTRQAEWNIAVVDNPLNITDFNPENTTFEIYENETSHFNITTSRNTTSDQWYINGTPRAESGQNLTILWTFDSSSFYLITYNGTDSIDNISKTWYVTVLDKNRPPSINISNISMELQNQASIDISANISDPDDDSMAITADDLNITVSGHTLIFNYTQTVLNKPVLITVNDSDLTADQTIYINITDTISPDITILSPLNKTYSTQDITLNFSINGDAGWCAYSLNGQPNITADCTGTENITAQKNQNNLTLWANDTNGNLNFTIVYFTVDTVAPDFTINAKNYTTDNYLYINISISEMPDTCTLDWQEENMTMDKNGTHCYINKTSINPGTYNYTIHVNDTAGNTNSSNNLYVEIYYCIESWSEWSSCISGSRSRTYTGRSCQTSTETETCTTTRSSSHIFYSPPQPPEDDNVSGEQNISDDETIGVAVDVDENVTLDNMTGYSAPDRTTGMIDPSDNIDAPEGRQNNISSPPVPKKTIRDNIVSGFDNTYKDLVSILYGSKAAGNRTQRSPAFVFLDKIIPDTPADSILLIIVVIILLSAPSFYIVRLRNTKRTSK